MYPSSKTLKILGLLSVFTLFSLVILSSNIFRVNAATSKATLFFSVPSKVFAKGEKITLQVKVNTGGESINAVSGSFRLPTNNFQFGSVDLNGSILDFWAKQPSLKNDVLSFEGVALGRPYNGPGGLIFSVTGIAVANGTTTFNFKDGLVLVDDGHGTNILDTLQSLSFTIADRNTLSSVATQTSSPNLAEATGIVPPVITKTTAPVSQSDSFQIIGTGMPNALTKIQFQDVTETSPGVKFVRAFNGDRTPLTDVVITNDDQGVFSYTSPSNLIAGVYNAVPAFVTFDQAKSVLGYGVKIFVTDNTLSRVLLVIINALVLIIPIVALVLIIFFIPWYFRRRLRVIGKKLELEEEKLNMEEHHIMGGTGGIDGIKRP